VNVPCFGALSVSQGQPRQQPRVGANRARLRLDETADEDGTFRTVTVRSATVCSIQPADAQEPAEAPGRATSDQGTGICRRSSPAATIMPSR